MAVQARFTEDGKSQVIMKRTELEDVAWLADYGLRVWIAPGDAPLRCGEKLTYEKAQALGRYAGDF
jgi:hypothetical protein